MQTANVRAFTSTGVTPMQALHPDSAWARGPPSPSPPRHPHAGHAAGVPEGLLGELKACAEACRTLEHEWGLEQRSWPGVSSLMQRRHEALQGRARALGFALGSWGGPESMRVALELLPEPLAELDGWFEVAFRGIYGWAA